MDQFARWAPTIFIVVAWIFTYGKQTERAAAQELSLSEHKKNTDDRFRVVLDKQEDHSERIQQGEIEIAKLKAWNEGFNAATTKLKG